MIKAQLNTDKIAIGLSTACVIHCFFAPAVIVASYSFTTFAVESELIHYLILLLAIPISSIALVLGYRNHKTLNYLIIGFFGVLLLISAVIFFEPYFGKIGEQVVTFIGSCFVIFAHFKNHQICKKLACDCHE